MNWSKKVQRLLLNPYHPIQGMKGNEIQIVVGLGLLIALFLVIFQPFDIHAIESRYKLLYIFLYGPVTSLALAINYILLPKIFKFLYNEKSWNFLKKALYSLWTLTLIAILNWLYSYFVLSHFNVHHNFFNSLWFTFIVWILPMIFFTYLKERIKLRKHLGMPINEILYKTNGKDSGQLILFEIQIIPPVTITAENLLCIKSIGNYSQIYFKPDKEIKKEMVKKSLKEFTNELSERSKKVIRCHKSYIVNLNKVDKISGTTKGYKLHIKGLNFIIPVSRSLSIDDLNQLNLFPS